MKKAVVKTEQSAKLFRMFQDTKHREEQKQKAQLLAKELQELLQLAPSIVEQLINEVVISVLGSTEIEIGKQYIKTGSTTQQQSYSECTCATKIQAFEELLCLSGLLVTSFSNQLRASAVPFCEESFKSDDFTKFYTGLSNIGIVKSVLNIALKA